MNGVCRGGSYMEGYQIREKNGYRLQLGKVSPSRNVGFRLSEWCMERWAICR